MELRLRRPVRLRTRITVSFAFIAALASLIMSISTYSLARRNLLQQRERSSIQSAYVHARALQAALTSQSTDKGELSDALNSLGVGSGSAAIIRMPTSEPTEHGSGPAVDEDALVSQSTRSEIVLDDVPMSLRADVDDGDPAMIRTAVGKETMLVVGLPLPSLEASGRIGSYYEIVSLEDISSTLNTITIVLLITMIGTTVLGTALGWWISRGVLRPLGSIGLAAEAIASGRLGTRLEETSDPDLAKLVDTFNHMASNLEDRIERDARFTSDVSHELRSPITTLTASMGVLEARRDDIPDGPARAAIDLMTADLERFQQLVEDLLEISRYDSGAIRLELSEVRITELVDATLASRHTRIPVQVEAGLEQAKVRVDKRRLSRVLANLLDNADKYGDGATGIEVSRSDDHVRIAIEDAGPGVPESDREVIFDRFARGSAAGRRSASSGGVGLGLALVSEHMHLQGGEVWLEDRPDGGPGARFVIEVGAVIESEPAARDEPEVPV